SDPIPLCRCESKGVAPQRPLTPVLKNSSEMKSSPGSNQLTIIRNAYGPRETTVFPYRNRMGRRINLIHLRLRPLLCIFQLTLRSLLNADDFMLARVVALINSSSFNCRATVRREFAARRV